MGIMLYRIVPEGEGTLRTRFHHIDPTPYPYTKNRTGLLPGAYASFTKEQVDRFSQKGIS